ncbi:MAG: enoyl-CoA hydratase/isomerase family protein [Dehalococcoidia bacterium]
MTFEDIVYDKSEAIATLRFNRPHRMNACTLRTYAELAEALEDAARDKSVRVIIITGEGRGFCSGDDVQDIFLAESEEAQKAARLKRRIDELTGMAYSGADELIFLDKPTIAAVNGPAVGYGMDMALMCDLRVASELARFGEVFVKRGLMADAGALLLLPRLVGWAKAAELIYTGDIIDAQEAYRIGLVNKLVPHEELMDVTLDLARKIAANAPLGTRLSKQGLRRSMGFDLHAFLEWQSTCQRLLFETEDHKEGARSFVEKRQPAFRGR